MPKGVYAAEQDRKTGYWAGYSSTDSTGKELEVVEEQEKEKENGG